MSDDVYPPAEPVAEVLEKEPVIVLALADYAGSVARVLPAKGGQFTWRVEEANGETILSSETLTSRAHAERMARKWAPYAEVVVEGFDSAN
jgi:uncharacterized protein YegP (UPF0339 family)